MGWESEYVLFHPNNGGCIKKWGGRVKKQIPVKIDADIVRWFKKEKNHDINTILKGHIKIVEAQRKIWNKAASIPDQFFRPMLKPDKKKGKGKIKK